MSMSNWHIDLVNPYIFNRFNEFKNLNFRDHQVAQVVQVTVKTEMEMKVSMFSKADKAFKDNYYCTTVAKLYK